MRIYKVCKVRDYFVENPYVYDSVVKILFVLCFMRFILFFRMVIK